MLGVVALMLKVAATVLLFFRMGARAADARMKLRCEGGLAMNLVLMQQVVPLQRFGVRPKPATIRWCRLSVAVAPYDGGKGAGMCLAGGE